ncbi:MAG TPA: DMT family transporter [Rhodocyclaceae bacterium]|nr:DMT family transporter [Rhodocyclaceae bacterium]
MTQISTRQYSIGLLLAGIAALGFSFKAILVKLAYLVPTGIPLNAVTLLTLRMLYSLPVFAYIAWRESQDKAPLSGKQLGSIAVLGMFGYYGASLFDFIGLQYISAGLERLVLAIYPTLTLLLSVFVFGEKLTRRKLAACAICYLGIAAAFMHDLNFAADNRAIWIGSGFVFASAVSYAIYLAGTGRMLEQIGTQRFTALAMLVSTAITFLHFVATTPLTAIDQPLQTHLLAAGMALFSTIIPVFALSAAIRRIGAPNSALVGSSGPLLTILFGWWLLNEPISLVQLAGLLLVVGGVSLIGKR